MRSVVLIWHNIVLLGREPGPVLARIVMPLVLITALQPLYTAALGGDGIPHAVTGMLILFSLLGLSVVSGSILTERAWRTLDRLRATPARPVEILVGKALPYAAVLAVQQTAIIAYGMVVLGLPVRRPDLLLLAALTWTVTLLCAGAALATVVRSMSELGLVTDLGALFLTVVGGALVPLTLMPDWLRTIAPVSPGYWALSGLRSALAGDTLPTLRSTGMLAVMAVVFGAIAAWRIARGWGRARLL